MIVMTTAHIIHGNLKRGEYNAIVAKKLRVIKAKKNLGNQCVRFMNKNKN